MKVLIAEDNIVNQSLLVTFMEKWEIEPIAVSNGRDAVEISQKELFDLCIMDIRMPILDGLQATKIIRERPKYLPIIGISGNYIKNECIECGMDDFLPKPYHLDELRKKISELTVKCTNIQYNNDEISISKETPVDSDHLKELMELDKKGLTKLILRDLNHEFIVHKNVQNKIANDLIGKGLELTEFLDRSEKKPGICHLYKSNLSVTMRCLLPEEYDKYLIEEDNILKNHTEPSYKLSEEDTEYNK